MEYPKNIVTVYFTDTSTPFKFEDTRVWYSNQVVEFAGKYVAITFPIARIRSIIVVEKEREDESSSRQTTKKRTA